MMCFLQSESSFRPRPSAPALHAMIGRVNILDDQALFVLTLETALRYVRLAIHRPSRRTGAPALKILRSSRKFWNIWAVLRRPACVELGIRFFPQLEAAGHRVEADHHGVGEVGRPHAVGRLV